MKHASMIITILMAVALGNAAAADTVAPPPATNLAQLSSDSAALQHGFDCLERGQYDTAYAFFAPRLLETPDDADILFGYGLACLHTQRISHAVFAFETILERLPDVDRVRLELARAYLAAGRSSDARREFATVLTHNPPAEVRQNIENILQEIDRTTPGARVEFHGTIATYAFNSNNVNAGLATSSVMLKDASFAIDGANQSRSDAGLIALGSFALTAQPKPDLPLLLQPALTIYQKWHDSFRENDLTYLAPSVTALYQPHERWLLTLAGELQDVTYDYRALSRTWRGALTARYAFHPSATAATELSAEHLDHKTTYTRSGNAFSIKETLVMQLPRDMGWEMAGGYTRTRAIEERYASRAWELSSTLNITLPWTSALALAAGYDRTAYDDPSTSAMAGIDRKDRGWNLSGTLRKTLAERWSLSYEYAYSRNNSNTDIHDYRIGTHTLGLSYSF